jgi:hypothetical protein
MKAIGLYNCGGVGLDLAYSNGISDICYVDPYPSVRRDWEKRISNERRIAERRVVWGAIDLQPTASIEDVLAHVVPYMSERGRQEILEGIKEREIKLPNDAIERIIDNSRRTIHGGNSPLIMEARIKDMAAFWISYIEYAKIDLFICSLVPHSFVDLILAECCRFRRVPFICQVTIGMARHAMHLDYTTGQYLEAEGESSGLESDIVALLENCKSPSSSFRTAYSPGINTSARSAIASYKKRLISGGKLQQKILMYKSELAGSYDRLAKRLEDIECRGRLNILFLHYQPELSTSPLAHNLFDQRKIVAMIKERMKPEDVLVVKEHPRQFIDCGLDDGSEDHIMRCLQYRTPSYYEEIASWKQCFLLSRGVKNSQIFNLSKVTTWSATGTVNLQAFLNDHEVGFLPTLSPFFLLTDDRRVNSVSRYAYAQKWIKRFSFPMIRGEAIQDIYLNEEGFMKLVMSVDKSCHRKSYH